MGTVCFAVCGPGTTRTSTKLFAGERERVRMAAAYYALDLARRYFDTRKTMTVQQRPQLRRRAAARERSRPRSSRPPQELARELPGRASWSRKVENLHVT